MSKVDARDIEEFLCNEAALLDDRKYEEWLTLFADDSYYWIPTGKEEGDPGAIMSFVYDDRSTLAIRVSRLLHPAAHCQTPPSRTRHLIGSNIRIERPGEGDLKVYSNFALFESRLGNQRIFGGHCEHQLRRQDDAWKIAAKKVCLINADGVFSNLTFLF